MYPVCYHLQSLRRRGLGTTGGTDVSKGICKDQFDSADTVKFVDEFGHAIYQSTPETFPAFAAFIQRGKNNKSSLIVETIAGRDLLSFGDGPILSLPHAGLVESSDLHRTYYFEREDGLMEKYELYDAIDKNYWEGTHLLETKLGKKIRTRNFDFGNQSAGNSLPTLKTTWFFGDIPYISVIDTWKIPPKNNPIAGQVSLFYDNPIRHATSNTIKFDALQSRLDFYQRIDNFVAEQEVILDPDNQTVTLNGVPLLLEGSELSPPPTNVQYLDALLGAIKIAPFVDLAGFESVRIFVGNGTNLSKLAKSAKIPAYCLDGIQEGFVNKKNIAGLYCIADRKIFLQIDESSQEGKHNTTLAHELFHVLHHDNLVPLELLRSIFIKYATLSLEKAGVPTEGEEMAFLKTLYLNESTVTYKLSDDQKKQLAEIWKKYSLATYFPTAYSLSNEKEFFANLFELYTPWHDLDQLNPYYSGFFIALDAMADLGPESFIEEVDAEYPELGIVRSSKVPESTASTYPSENRAVEAMSFGLFLLSSLVFYLGGKIKPIPLLNISGNGHFVAYSRSLLYFRRFAKGFGVAGMIFSFAIFVSQCPALTKPRPTSS